MWPIRLALGSAGHGRSAVEHAAVGKCRVMFHPRPWEVSKGQAGGPATSPTLPGYPVAQGAEATPWLARWGQRSPATAKAGWRLLEVRDF